jgi:hypothetical protein
VCSALHNAFDAGLGYRRGSASSCAYHNHSCCSGSTQVADLLCQACTLHPPACSLLRVQFDVTFPKMPCSWLSLDAMDISGEMHLDVVST